MLPNSLIKYSYFYLLKWIKDTVSCVECCVRHILSTPGTVELSCVQSLPFCAVRVLREAYAHCKDSTSLYGDLLDHVGDFLADLFKRTHSLQVVSLFSLLLIFIGTNIWALGIPILLDSLQ